MTNEVEIVVVGKNQTGRTFAAVEQEARAAGGRSGKHFGDGFDRDSHRGVKSALGKVAAEGVTAGSKLGLNLGTSISDSLMKTLSSTGPGGAAVGAAIVGIGAVAAPGLGAALAAGVIGGAAGVGIIGGIMLVKDDPRVTAAATAVGQRISQGLRVRAEPIVEPLINGMRIFEGAVNRSGANFGKVFQNVSKFIEPLANAAGEFTEDVARGLASITGKGAPVVDVLVRGAKEFGQIIGDGLTMLSDVGPEAAVALEVTLAVAAASAKSLFGSIYGLAKLFGAMIDLSAKFGRMLPGDSLAEQLDRELDSYRLDLDSLSGSFDGLSEAADGARSAMQGVADQLKAQTDPAFALIEAQKGLATAQENYNKALREHGAGSKEATAAELDLAKAALQMQSAAEGAGNAFNGAMTPALRATLKAAGLSDAAIQGVERSMRNAAQAGKAFGRGYVANIKLLGLGGVQGAAGAARRAIASIPSTKYVTIYSRIVGPITAGGYVGRASGGNVGAEPVQHAAEGGARGAMTLVGEQGPELVRLPFGSTVIPNGQTRSMLAGAGQGGGSGPVAVQVQFTGNTDTAFATAFMKMQQAGLLTFKAQYVKG